MTGPRISPASRTPLPGSIAAPPTLSEESASAGPRGDLLTFSRLLVPIDGSAISHTALSWAERLAAPTQAEIFLLQVVQPLASPFAARPTPTFLATAAKQERREVEATTTGLSNLAHALHGRDVQASRFVEVGSPALKILEFVTRHGIDLLVMGTHGRGGLSRAVLGSVADEVRRGTDIPVLLIPRHAEPPVGDLSVLICLDGSAGAEGAFSAGLTLARGLGAPIVLFESVEHLGPSLAAADYLDAKAELARAAGLQVNTSVGHGEPGADILLHADVMQASVIALASHGRSGVARIVLGSVASHVLSASRVPVLLSRRTAQ